MNATATRPRREEGIPALAQFFHTIGEHGLIGVDDEIALACTMRSGSPSEAQAARDRMILANQRLVVSIAKAYMGRGLALDDLIAEGGIGLIRAVDMFDPDFGCKFSTYANRWIKQSIRLALFGLSPIRLPGYLRTDIAAEDAGRQKPTDRRPGRDLWTAAQERRYGDHLKAAKVARALIRQTSSPDAASGPSGDSARYLANIAVDDHPGPLDAASDRADMAFLIRLVDALPEKERRVVVLRHGLDGGGPLTFREIGKAERLCTEWVRKRYGLATRRLKSWAADAGVREDELGEGETP